MNNDVMEYADVCNLGNMLMSAILEKEESTDNLVIRDSGGMELGISASRKLNVARELDDSGGLEMMCAVEYWKGMLSHTYLSLERLLEDKSVVSQYEKLNSLVGSKVYKDYRKKLVKGLESAIAYACECRVISDGTSVESIIDEAVSDILDEFEKLKFEVYMRSERPVDVLNGISSRVIVCGSLAECLTGLEHASDGVYLCFVSVMGTLDGWFGLFFKSNGNLFSYNDRIDEVYKGQHVRLSHRNGGYVEGKGFSIFPYDLCDFSEDRDSKGYSKSFDIGKERDMLLAGGDYKAFVRVVLLAVLMIRRHAGRCIDAKNEVVYVDSLFPQNLQKIEDKESKTTELIKVKSSEVASIHEKFSIPDFDVKDVITGKYDALFDCDRGNGRLNLESGVFKGNNQSMVDAYGGGFVIDKERLVASTSSMRLLGGKKGAESCIECIGTRRRFELLAYYEIRRQLANHITKQMYGEYLKFGDKEGLVKWYHERLWTISDKLLTICSLVYDEVGIDGVKNFGREEEEGCFLGATTFPMRVIVQGRINFYDNFINKVKEDKSIKCLSSDATANVLFTFRFGKGEQVSELLGCELPKFCTGWKENYNYNGNCLLDVVDPVGELTSPFQREFNFTFTVGFSKKALKAELKRIKGDKRSRKGSST